MIFNKRCKIQSDVSPVVKNGRTLVPISVIDASLGAEGSWNDAAKKQVFIEMNDMSIRLTINKKTAIITTGNKKGKVDLDVAPAIIQGRTMVPLSFIASYLGFDVQWDKKTKSVLIDCSLPVENLRILEKQNDQSQDNAHEGSDIEIVPGADTMDGPKPSFEDKSIIPRDKKTIVQVLVNSPAYDTMDSNPPDLLPYLELPLLVQEKYGLLVLREKLFPGEYLFYGYPDQNPHNHYIRFYANQSTGKVDGSFYPDGYEITLRSKAGIPGFSPIAARYLIQSDGCKLAEYDILFASQP